MLRLLTTVLALLSVATFALTAFAYAARARVLQRGGPWPQPEPVGVTGGLLGFAREWLDFTLALLRSLFPWELRLVEPAGKGTVVLVHDWGMTGGSLLVLSSRLRRAGWRTIVLSGQPLLRQGIALAAERLRQTIDSDPGELPITLIGHGLGGLVVRYYCHQLGSARVRRLLTLGSPYRGSETAGRLWPDAVRPGAPLLRELYPDVLAARLDVIALHSSFDALVLPPVNALYPNAFNIQLNDVGHFTLLYSRRVYGLIAENLEAPLPDPGKTGISNLKFEI